MRRSALFCACMLLGFLASSCRQDMHDQPRFEPLEASPFFADGRASRPQVPGTIARGELRLDAHLYEGKAGDEFASTFPMPITPALLTRGRERYDIFCSACHDRAGYGQGLAVLRGVKQPPSYHIDRLREAPPGYLFDVITHGFGAMFDLRDRTTPEDRWAIVAYVRALQRSQNASLDDVPDSLRAGLGRAPR